MKPITQYIITSLLSTVITSSFAQTSSLNGIVKDKETGQLLESVTVTIQQLNIHSHTDVNGMYNLLSLPAGSFQVEFEKPGYAQQNISVSLTDNEQKKLNIEMIFNAITLHDVEIAADKPVSAASSQYLSKLDFENRPKNSAQDMLKLVPGLFIAQHAGGGKAEQIFIRGFDCDHGTDVATFVDGIPVNMPSHGHGQGYEDLHFLIPETVEGMDIFKGPYAPQYGNFATGAAVAFKTKDSLENNLVQMETGYVPEVENISTTRALALLKMPDIGKNITSYFAADVINNRNYFEESQHFKRISLFSKTTIAVSDHSHIHFSVGGFGSSWDASGQVPERAVDAGMISRFGSIDNSEGGTTQRNNINLTYHTQLRNAEFETQVYSSNYRFKLFSNFTFFAEDTINGDEIEQDDNRTIRGLNARYTIPHKLGNMNNKFTIGASYRADDIENQLWHAVKRERLEVRAHANIQERATGIYFNEVFRFSDHFRMEAGGRYDYFIFDVDDLLPSDSGHINYSGFNYQSSVNPKLNFIYSPSDHLQLFLNTGIGFHSNDARSSVQEKNNHDLPQAPGAELGSLLHISNRIVTSLALWWLDLENELVYVGDDGTTENKGASRRVGIDFSIRYQITSWLCADADLNISKNRFINKAYGDEVTTDFYIPLAPQLTSAGGLTAKSKNGIEAAARYRYLASRPANESNTVTTRGYNVIDANISYTKSHYKIGLTFENVSNTEWNEAQFDTESRLPGETETVDELHFTPGTPFSAKLIVGYLF